MIPDLGEILFFIIVALTIGSAYWVVMSPNLVHSAVSLLFTLFGIAGLYVFLFADFIAASQVIIYVGGILVLIIFGVMLTNKIDDPMLSNQSQNQILAGIFCLILLIFQFQIIFNTNWYLGELFSRESTVDEIGILLLSTYLLPFEVVSVLLLAALIGSAMLSRKKVD
ncbi:NADH-quinone oxidoreductase subunit J [Candidatus Marinimicrobia bacterium]|nr:NADH-quinone oxidoreductase subunit J [Candidatus Neomarinimicrobiota bacterium]